MDCFSMEPAVIGLKMFSALIRRKLKLKFESIDPAKLESIKFAARQASSINATRESSTKNSLAQQAFYSMKKMEFVIGLIMSRFCQLKLLNRAMTESTDSPGGQMLTTTAMITNDTTDGAPLGSPSIRRNQSQVV